MSTLNIPIQETIAAVTAATNKGLLTVADNTVLYPGTFGWLTKNDGSASTRVYIVARVGANQVSARAVASGTEQTVPAPSYGRSDLSAYNAASSLCIEAQTAPVVAANSVRQVG